MPHRSRRQECAGATTLRFPHLGVAAPGRRQLDAENEKSVASGVPGGRAAGTPGPCHEHRGEAVGGPCATPSSGPPVRLQGQRTRTSPLSTPGSHAISRGRRRRSPSPIRSSSSSTTFSRTAPRTRISDQTTSSIGIARPLSAQPSKLSTCSASKSLSSPTLPMTRFSSHSEEKSAQFHKACCTSG